MDAVHLTAEDVGVAFRDLDLDKNGYVGAAEIAHVLKQIGERVTDDEVDEMILMGDLDGAAKTGVARPPLTPRNAGDGQLSFEEFSKLMKTLALPRAAPASARASSDAGRGAAASPVPSPGNALQELEVFQRMHGLDAPALRRVHAKFREVDTDGMGLVNLSDFCRMLRVERSPFVERLFAMFDTDRDGLVDLKEFIIGLSNVSGDVREDKVRFAFELFDMDGSGFIEEPELRRIVRATNLASEKQLDRKVRWLLSQCDGDGDGKISLAEFEGLASRFPNAVFPAYSLAASLANVAVQDGGN